MTRDRDCFDFEGLQVVTELTDFRHSKAITEFRGRPVEPSHPWSTALWPHWRPQGSTFRPPPPSGAPAPAPCRPLVQNEPLSGLRDAPGTCRASGLALSFDHTLLNPAPGAGPTAALRPVRMAE